MRKTRFSPSISKETVVCRVLEKTGLKWIYVQRKEILTKNYLKLPFKFTQNVCSKLSENFWEEECDSIWMRQVLLTK